MKTHTDAFYTVGIHTFEDAAEDSRLSARYIRRLFEQASCLQGAVLNRARPENEEKERKTASGRTFKVQG